jgi:glutamine amidotransferase
MIDYGIGNYRSVQKALEFVGAKVTMTRDPDAIRHADKLVLPGVGAFGAAIDALRERDLEQPIHDAVAKGTPLLGICVGMQLLLDESEELGQHTGLGLIPGKVRKFPASDTLKIPHMGWNQLDHDGSSPLLKDVTSGDYAYFVHSFFCDVEDSADTITTTEYGQSFSSIIGRNNIYGIQFHAEKSQHVGLQILKNYINL